MDPTIGLNSYSVAYRQPQEFSIANQVNYFYDLKIQENMKQDPLNDKMINSAQQLVKQIRSGRKVFKLLRYVEEFNDLVLEVKDFSMSHLQSALRSIFVDFSLTPAIPALDNLCSIIAKIASVCYYFLENCFWIVSTGMISEKIFNKKRWKKYKDIFSLVRNWFPLFRSIMLYKHAKDKLAKIDKEFSGYEN